MIHYSDRAHKWLLIAEDAGLVMDGVDGCIACADALDDDFFPPIRSTRWYVRDPHNGKHFLCNTVHVGVCMCNASPHCLRSVRSLESPHMRPASVRQMAWTHVEYIE